MADDLDAEFYATLRYLNAAERVVVQKFIDARVSAARAETAAEFLNLHAEITEGMDSGWCVECGHCWPCATARLARSVPGTTP